MRRGLWENAGITGHLLLAGGVCVCVCAACQQRGVQSLSELTPKKEEDNYDFFILIYILMSQQLCISYYLKILFWNKKNIIVIKHAYANYNDILTMIKCHSY